MTRTAKQRRERWRQGATVLIGVTGLLTLATGAIAAWSVSGSDSKNATIATVQPLVVTVSAPLDLFPGAVRTVNIAVQNTNPFPIVVDRVEWTSVTALDASCDTTNITVAGRTAIGQTIAAGATGTVSVPSGVTLKTTAVEACQGKGFTLTALVTGSSAS